jgi:hypothetical protein
MGGTLAKDSKINRLVVQAIKTHGSKWLPLSKLDPLLKNILKQSII